MKQGNSHNYWWLEGTDLGIGDLVNACPEIFVNRTVAITAFDSGPIKPNDNEKSKGWYSKGNVFYAKNVITPSELPYEQFDEWYIFDELVEFTPGDLFVNYGGFCLSDTTERWVNADPTWCKKALNETDNYIKERQKKFWHFVEKVAPRIFLLDGDLLIVGCKYHHDMKIIKKRFAEQIAGNPTDKR